MADPMRPNPGVNNPLLPNNADNSNLTNRSGSTREAVADATSRALDTDETDDIANASAGLGTGGLREYDDRGTLYDPNRRTVVSGAVPSGTAPLAAGYGGTRYYAPATGREHLSALFANQADAQDAVNRLEALGVSRADISIIYRDADAQNRLVNQNAATGSQAGEGAGTGSIIGGVIGAILGALAATATSVIIPGIGIIVAGPIAGALAGAGAGGLTGGILGALVGAGIPEETARSYEVGINNGGVVVVADVPANVAPQARAILNTAAY